MFFFFAPFYFLVYSKQGYKRPKVFGNTLQFETFHNVKFETFHMDGFTQPQQKYAGTGENCNIATPVIFFQ